jgi:hypothetical protein
LRTALWGGLLAVAALWPARLAGPLDGAPLDASREAVLIGLVLPALLVFHPPVLRHLVVRGLIVALLLWKAGTALTLAQDGWCLRFTSPVPLFVEQEVVPHSWDIRADWRSPVPECSAVMTRAYATLEQFPAWFYNLPPANFRQPAQDSDRPPNVPLRVDLHGYLQDSRPGVLSTIAGDDVRVRLSVDGVLVPAAQVSGVTLPPGPHRVTIEADLAGSRWSLAPLWNGGSVWTAAIATRIPASWLDRAVRPWGRLIPAVLLSAIVLLALAEAVRRVRDGRAIGAAIVLSSLAFLAAMSGRSAPMRALPLLALTTLALTSSRRLRNLSGAWLFLALPLLTLFATLGWPQAGTFTLYTSGDDFWMFQRYAYRIFMEGYWLEGGQPTFWFQPFYRWVAGALHMVFGDSSVGELFWDTACVLTGALFAFHVTRVTAGFRWGIAAGSLTLAVMTLGPAWYLFGRGLSEITSMGFIYAAALLALRGRHGAWLPIVLAGLFATLGFYTRLNNLVMVLALAAFALPVRQPVDRWWQPGSWWPRVSREVLAGVFGMIALGLWLFTARTYYYTGVPSMIFGTQAGLLSVWQTTGEGLTPLQNVAGSLLMVLTMNDPPRFDIRALPILIGTAAAVGGLLGAPVLRRLPMNLVALCLGGLVGALVARGSAYPGRFSVHLIPVTVALATCALSLVVQRAGSRIERRELAKVDER